ncbi:MAG TPA: hypothetical protein VNY73_01265, partial [Bacteroidia bacterium]|nr:hypothetical protein [Bacteroidia bacterium]
MAQVNFFRTISNKYFFLVIYFVFAGAYAQPTSSRILLPNGWALSPAGSSLRLGDLPLNMAVSPSGKYIAVTNNGQSDQGIFLIDAVNEKILDTIVCGKLWYGLQFSGDEKKLYASGGNDNFILVFDVSAKKIKCTDTIYLGKP